MKKIAASSTEQKNNQQVKTAPGLRKAVANQNDDQNSLKRIQIEEEEVRQIELQIKRENQRREQDIQKQRVMAKQIWKPVVAENAADKEKDVDAFVEPPTTWNLTHQGSKRGCKQSVQRANDEEQELENWCVETLKTMNNANIDSKKLHPSLIIHAYSIL
jgi:hypothetical protein